MLDSSWMGDAGAESVLCLCWHSRCRRKSTLRWKARSHIPHLNGLYPECLRMWVIRLELWLNDFRHTTHLCGFSPAKQKIELRISMVFKAIFSFFYCIQWTISYSRAIQLIFWMVTNRYAKPHSNRCIDSDLFVASSSFFFNNLIDR